MNPYLLIDLKQTNLSIQKDTIQEDNHSIYPLLKQLSHRLQVICSLKAVDMIYPIWEKYMSKNRNFTKKEKETLKKLIEIINKRLKRKATKKEVEQAQNDLEAIDVSYTPVRHVIYAASLAGSVITATRQLSFTEAYNAIFEASQALALDQFNTKYHREFEPNVNKQYSNDPFKMAELSTQFYNEWWEGCYPLIQKDLRDQYDILCDQVRGDI